MQLFFFISPDKSLLEVWTPFMAHKIFIMGVRTIPNL
jgi:hypothetical protein